MWYVSGFNQWEAYMPIKIMSTRTIVREGLMNLLSHVDAPVVLVDLDTCTMENAMVSYPNHAIVLYTEAETPPIQVFYALGRGAAAFLLHPSFNTIVRTVELVADGVCVLSVPLRKEETPDHQWRFSVEEERVLRCLRDGMPTRAIAAKLDKSEATVKVQTKAVLKKIGVINRTQAAVWALTNLGGPE
jgi:DNA-binding NarL/FixJ family response regulator